MFSIAILILEMCILSFLHLFGSGSMSGIVAILSIIIFTICFWVGLHRNKSLGPYKSALFLGYLWRILLVFWDVFGKSIYQLPNSGKDSVMFYDSAVEFTLLGSAERGGVFSALMGSIFSAVGWSQLFGQFIIALFSVAALCLFALMVNNLRIDEQVKRKSVAIIALLPNFAILSSIFLRESIVCLFISISLWLFCRWMKNQDELLFILAIVVMLVASTIHSGSIAVAIGYLIVRFIYNKKKRKFSFSVVNVIPVTVATLVLVYLFLNYSEVFFGKFSAVDSIEDIAGTNASGGSSYAAYVGNTATPLNMLIYTIPRIVYFLFSPFPWQWRGLSDIIAFIFSSLFYFVVLLNAIRYLHSGKTENRELLIALLIISAVSVFVFAWGVSNTGTATRHRDKLVIVFGLIYALSHKMHFRKMA